MLYREIIAVCSQIHTKHINTLRGQNVELIVALAKLWPGLSPTSCPFVRRSVRTDQLDSHWADFNEI